MSEAAAGTGRDFSREILSCADIPACVQLVVQNFSLRPADVEAWFDRRIINNPWQRSLPGMGVGIRESGHLIACRAMFGQPWWLNGESTIVAFASHTAVDPRYRGLGLANGLITASTRFAAITGSTSAGSITQKAYGTLGFCTVGGVDNDFFRTRASFRGSVEKRAGKPLGTWLGSFFDLGMRLRNSKLRIPAGFALHLESRCNEEFDVLWERARSGYTSCLERTSDYLNWRLFDYPTRPLFLTSARDSSGELRAYGIWHLQSYSETVKAAVLRDLFCSADDDDAMRALLGLLLDHWRASGVSWVSLEVASPTLSALFRQLGYEHVPSIGNRYHVYCQTSLDPEVMNNWFRSGIDGDYFDLPVPADP